MFSSVGFTLALFVLALALLVVGGLWGLHRVLNHFKSTSGRQVVKFKLQARKTSVELYVADREHYEPAQLESPAEDRNLPGAG
ncbi:hypothetical protein LZ318_35150 [Saccharopolyspora indica]|uniref:hypothetical protein n=1 Tax=Saccharopolyspora indica TaxID=1229659 RepID=UPI0022EAABED|nr:hypothetical protein [Saccharopolyspora indica]MDA3649824.1 hypothetical protein [Saccharopolyspora indica]